ncbi:hypothetical protein KY332_04870 [Candidatus Woesearchaeota archaeon]|nr:hypothetical protein [Candidatus Woesearchaeota archaeon]
MKRIEEIVNKASEEIKEIVMKEAKKIKFPEIMIGINDPKHATESTTAGDFDEIFLPGSEGIALPKEGIIVYDDDKFWSEREYIIFLPDGLYKFRAGLFLASRNKKPTNMIRSFPDWNSRKETPRTYINYGSDAISKIREYVK